MVTAAAATEMADGGNAGRPLAVVTQNYRAKPIKGVAFGLHPLLVNLCTGWVGKLRGRPTVNPETKARPTYRPAAAVDRTGVA